MKIIKSKYCSNSTDNNYHIDTNHTNYHTELLRTILTSIQPNLKKSTNISVTEFVVDWPNLICYRGFYLLLFYNYRSIMNF